MRTTITFRDWTYLAVIAALAVTYALGLLGQASASVSAPHICLYSDASGTRAK